MQSVHSCSVQTHFLVFEAVLKKNFPGIVNWVEFEVNLVSKCDNCVEKGFRKLR